MALPFEYLQDILQQENQQEVPSTMPDFSGPLAEAKTTLDEKKSAWGSAYQGMLDSRRQALQKQRTDNLAMAKYNALGKLLTTMTQPIGWAVGGSTAATPQYDDRQYLESFNRAVQANDDLRNIGVEDDAFKFRVAEQEMEDAQEEYNAIRAAKIKSELYSQRQNEELEKIYARGDVQMNLAELKAKYKITHGGIPVSEKMLSSAWTAYNQKYLSNYQARKLNGQPVPEKPLTFLEYLGDNKIGFGFNIAENTKETKPKDGREEGGLVKKDEREHGDL